MHYYQHNIGDYRRDTSHLTLLEHGIYRQLLDTYYLSEKPLTADRAQLMRTHCIRSADEQQAADCVLAEFFTLTDDGYVHARCTIEIQNFHGKSEKASKSAKERWKKHNKSKKLNGHANALQTHSERNADGMLTINHKPITNNQEKRGEKRGDARGEDVSRQGAPPTTGSRSKTGTRIPDDFTLTPERRQIALNEKLDPERVFANFTDYWKQQSGARARKADWEATWRFWCRNEFSRSTPATNKTKSTMVDGTALINPNYNPAEFENVKWT